MKFGEKLQLLRRSRGWSQEDLAQQISVSRQALSKWESGAAVPDTENVVALSRLFGVSTDYLLLEKQETAGTPAAAVPAREKKWPVPRIVWLVLLFISALGLVALQIWAGTLSPTTMVYWTKPDVVLTGIRNLIQRYDLGWIVIVLWVLLILGFLGTFFCPQMQKFVKKHFLD